MRQLLALASLLLLSLSRLGATTHERVQVVASVARPTREMVVAAPSLRLVPMALRELSARAPARLLAPWHPSRAEAGIVLSGALGRAVTVLPEPTSLAVGPAVRLTYDATAPPRLS
jgi:hypothetical protein